MDSFSMGSSDSSVVRGRVQEELRAGRHALSHNGSWDPFVRFCC